MIGIGPGARVMVATRPVDFRKGPDALATLVAAEYGGGPYSGVIYVSRAKRTDRIKLVWWDGTGLCLMAKRLESGGFKWPGNQDGVMRLTSAQLGALLEGLGWRRVHGGRRPIAPQIAGWRGFRLLIHCFHAHGSGPSQRHRSAPCARPRTGPRARCTEGFQTEVERLKAIIDALQRHRFGRRSEQMDPDQFELALKEVETALAEAEYARDKASLAPAERPHIALSQERQP
jgi:transposase